MKDQKKLLKNHLLKSILSKSIFENCKNKWFSNILLFTFLLFSLGIFGCAASDDNSYEREIEKGLRYLDNNDNLKAISSFNKAIKYNKYSFEPYFYRGIAKCGLYNYSDAVNDFTSALKYNSEYFIYTWRGYSYLQLSEYRKAKKDIEQALRLNSYDYLANCYLGILYFKENKYTDAIEKFEYSFEMNSDVNDYVVQQALLYLIEIYVDYYPKPDDALYFLERLKYVIPESCGFNFYTAKAYYLKENYLLADDYFTKVINDCPDYERYNEAYYNRGAVNYAKEDYVSAIDDFTKAIELKSDDATYFQSRGYAYYQIGNYSDAISDFETAISIDPNLEDELREMINDAGY